ncbi:MAG: T9SS type A sorting domain-containing protein [Sphingobacteriales bacterium]|nr:MAG: T9SS type A sorting domain-containing protein [Sphingobacteriales bacterium]
MKKIFTSVAVIAACAVGAFAQKNIDLGFEITTPAELSTHPNVAANSDFTFTIKITNSGTDAVVATDTILMWNNGYSLLQEAGTGNLSLYWMPNIVTGLSIPAGQSHNYEHTVTKNSYIPLQNGDTLINYFWDNDTNYLLLEGYGWDNSGALFNDPGVDNANPDGDGALTGNNSTGTRSYILGTPTSLQDLFAKKAESLNVYPNPSNGSVNFKHTFTAAAEVAVKVTDIAGRVVFAQNYGKQAAGEQIFNMNLSDLANGVYAIEVTAGSQRATSKFTIKK